MDDKEDGLEVVVLVEYILNPFLEHFFEAYDWHDILATLYVCANSHATQHCNDKGYNIVSIILDPKREYFESNQYDEIVLERTNMDHSRFSTITSKNTHFRVPLMPMRMEITFVSGTLQSNVIA